ncbi:hypothetical protein ACFY2R_24220 [Micromonospora olivasterospora]|uniref:Uncharacterized protein n=1 Tax=Micromonospora olivasterospora TaxID=1880 RepID=A0A562I8N4_MICOL|nr:hypothetical protein [Micromonospora olivasterospora]TWH67252.1 hypothetical protein JD77_02224 [Micromonospora olivasterospora]
MLLDNRNLTPGRVAQVLFGLDPDRDERAPQLCAETLLTLAQNRYRAPARTDDLRSPKRQRFALRSLALATNFLAGREGRAGEDNMTPHLYGKILASGSDVRNSANLALAQSALQGLVDPDTQRGQPGAWLLRPFHESLLWYDARKAPSRPDWTVRKVYMRGSGITLARLLLAPTDPKAAEQGASAVSAIQAALTGPSPLADISRRLESALQTDVPFTTKTPDTEDDEKAAWERGEDELLQPLASSLCRHAEGVMCQGGASGPAKLWQLRTILALDLAVHALRVAWDTTSTPEEDRFLLLSFGGGPRAQDRIRQRSEESYRRARIRLNEATISTVARIMRQLVERKTVVWADEFENRRNKLDGEKGPDGLLHQLTKLTARSSDDDYLRLARTSVESANYGRAEDGFRVLLESVGLVAGTRYRYLTATPDLLAALVGALSSRMPMPSNEFFAAVRQEWGLVINQESAASTSLRGQVDGAGLERNARRAERLMTEAGLALSLSDRTTVVGERAQRRPK